MVVHALDRRERERVAVRAPRTERRRAVEVFLELLAARDVVGIGGVHPPRVDAEIVELLQVLPVYVARLGRIDVVAPRAGLRRPRDEVHEHVLLLELRELRRLRTEPRPYRDHHVRAPVVNLLHDVRRCGRLEGRNQEIHRVPVLVPAPILPVLNDAVERNAHLPVRVEDVEKLLPRRVALAADPVSVRPLREQRNPTRELAHEAVHAVRAVAEKDVVVDPLARLARHPESVDRVLVSRWRGVVPVHAVALRRLPERNEVLGVRLYHAALLPAAVDVAVLPDAESVHRLVRVELPHLLKPIGGLLGEENLAVRTLEREKPRLLVALDDDLRARCVLRLHGDDGIALYLRRAGRLADDVDDPVGEELDRRGDLSGTRCEVRLEAVGDLRRNLHDRAVLLLREAFALQLSVAEVADVPPRLEVGRLDEAEVVRVQSEAVVHENPHPVRAPPAARRLVRLALGVGIRAGLLERTLQALRDALEDSAPAALVADVEEVVHAVVVADDVRVDDVVAREAPLVLGRGEELERRLSEARHVGVEVRGVDDVARRTGETAGEVEEEAPRLVVPDGLGCPGARELAPGYGVAVDVLHRRVARNLREVEVDVSPLDEVTALQEHERAVVAPVVAAAVALPLRLAQSVALTEHVKVGRGDEEGSVGRAYDVRIAYALLKGNRASVDYRTVAVDGAPGASVVRDREMQGVVAVLVVRHHVGLVGLRSERRRDRDRGESRL